MSVLVIIPAAGSGTRLGSRRLPKQYQPLAGQPVIIHVLRVIENIDAIDSVAVAVNIDFIEYFRIMLSEYEITKVKFIIGGGAERQDSVYNIIKSGIIGGYNKVLVHDSVRPLASGCLFDKIIEELDSSDAVIPGIKPKDTIKEQSGNKIITHKRSNLYSIQTPQGFRTDLLAQAYFYAFEHGISGTDDSYLVENLLSYTNSAFKMKIIDGEELNIKITTKFDMDLAEFIMSYRLPV